MLIDVSRLVSRCLKGRFPTGVDRVVLEYVRHFRHRSSALVRFAGRWIEFGAEDSLRIFAALLEPDSERLRLLRRAVIRGYFLNWRRCRGGVLLNAGHSGLDHQSYSKRKEKRQLKAIFFLHDLIPISHAEYCRSGEDARHRKRVDTMLAIGAGLIVNSAATQDEVRKYAKQTRREIPKTFIAHLAPAALPRPFHGRPEKSSYFVMLGTIEPRKNHLLVLNVWRSLVAELGDEAPKLIVIGQRGWECEQVVDLLDRCAALQGHVTELPHCDDRELATWLAHAQALLFPSFIEGFGMPLVEALMLGVPVIASELPVFREIAGEIPLYLDPLDGPGWRRAVLEFVRPDSVDRQAQIERIDSYVPPTWVQHFAVVEDLLREIDVSG